MKTPRMVTGAQAEEIKARSGHYGFRCFFGIHDKVCYLWPTWRQQKISRELRCYRCGELFAIELLEKPLTRK